MEATRHRSIRVVALVVFVLAIGLAGSLEPAHGKKRSKGKEASSRPANDNFARAEQIKGLPFSTSFDASQATLESGEPSCAGIASSVWFTFTPRRNLDLVVQAASDAVDASVAAYVGSELDSLEQVACSSNSQGTGGDDPTPAVFSFYAERGTSYLLQVGPVEAGSGVIELELGEGSTPQPFVGRPGALPHGWKERVLLDETRRYESEGADLFRFEGRPSADGSMYDMDVWVAGNHVVDRLSLYTGGTIRERHSYRALGASDQSVAIQVKVRYDASNQQCMAGVGGECKLLLPRGPQADELTSGKAGRAELIVTVHAQRQASTAPIDPVTSTLRIPLVGYAAALLP